MLEIAVAVLGLFCVLLGGFSYQLALKLRQQAELQKERDAFRDQRLNPHFAHGARRLRANS